MAPTAKNRVATTNPTRPVASSRAMIDQVTDLSPAAPFRQRLPNRPVNPSQIGSDRALALRGGKQSR
jgi:hypothetical protein